MTKPLHGITVAHFLETHREKLQLTLAVGERGLSRLIEETTINRPALALTGWFKFFAHKRVQVLGAAEWSFMKSQPLDAQTAMRDKLEQLKHQRDSLAQERDKLLRRKDWLEKDDAYLELMSRDRLNRQKEGEYILRF